MSCTGQKGFELKISPMKSIPVINPVLYGFFNENFRREVNEFCRKVSFKLRHLNPFIESWIFQKVFSYVNGKKKLLFPKLNFFSTWHTESNQTGAGIETQNFS